MMNNFNNIPEDLKQMNNWVLWKLEYKKDENHNFITKDKDGKDAKKSKPPYQINNEYAFKNKPKTWTTFEKVIDTYNHKEIGYSGIGFIFLNNGYCAIDLDHCIENNVISENAQYIIDSLDSYTEKSQSGSGVHIIVKGSVPKDLHTSLIEIYSNLGYVALTGDSLCGNKIEERQEQLDSLYNTYQKVEKTPNNMPKPKEIQLNDDLLEKAFYGKNGFKIRALYNGDMSLYDNDQSRADQALCNYLAYYFNNDFNEIDNIFKKSALYREKWDRQDYKILTINKAINGCNQTYQEKIKENKENRNKIDNIDYPYKNYKNQPLKVWENLDYLFKLNNVKVRYNLLSREIEVIESKQSLNDLIVELNTLTRSNGLSLSKDDLTCFIKKIANKNSYNPVLQYLKNCKKKWDGVSRIKELCNTITTSGDNDFKEFLITKWLISAVHIIENKGNSNCEGVLVVQGKQHIGKTRWIRSIIPNQNWLKTGVAVDPSNKDSVSKSTKYWIIELGEMEATLKKDQAELKQFFTENSDEYREPYERFSNKFNRLTCFYATVNDLEFLKDATGNRRYWTIEALSINVDHNIDLEQLWGEVAILHDTGKITQWLNKEENTMLQDNNIKFEVKTSTEIKLLDSFDWENINKKQWKYFTATEISDFIDEKNPNLVGRALRKMMLNNDLINFNSNGRKYLMPPILLKKTLWQNYAAINK